jgi:multidrug efflux pump subunit AcrA (membrane-fusion protein)
MRLEDLDKILLSPEELQQAQQAQAEQAQQAAAQQQAQVDAQNQLLMADIENKEKDSQRKAAIAQEKLNQEQMKSQNELQISMIREQGEVKKQEEINQREIFKTMINYIIEQAKLKGDYGILLPSLMPPELKEYMMREMPNEYEQINQINSMR